MKKTEPASSADAEQAIQQVLQAERDAERAIRDCENEVQQILQDAQVRANRILARADERITNMEMRHGHKLDHLIRSIEREGDVELRIDARQQYDETELGSAVDRIRGGDVDRTHVRARMARARG